MIKFKQTFLTLLVALLVFVAQAQETPLMT